MDKISEQKLLAENELLLSTISKIEEIVMAGKLQTPMTGFSSATEYDNITKTIEDMQVERSRIAKAIN